MFSLVEEMDNIKEIFPEGKNYFKLLKDSKMIGTAIIKQDEDDRLYIFIKKELRGNGYGKILFSEILKELKNRGYNDITIKFQKNNIPMLKIVTSNGGLHLSTDEQMVKYIIPISIGD